MNFAKFNPICNEIRDFLEIELWVKKFLMSHVVDKVSSKNIFQKNQKCDFCVPDDST